MMQNIQDFKRRRASDAVGGEKEVVLSNGLHVRTEALSSQQKALLVSALTFNVHNAFAENGPSLPPVTAYRSTETHLVVPRCFDLARYLGDFTMVDMTNEGAPVDFEFQGALKQEQLEPFEACVKGLVARLSGIMCLPCGFGKTVLALGVVAALKRKTVVLVHKEFLMAQWADRIRAFLPRARVGKLQGKKCEAENVDVLVCMIQSVVNKEFDPCIFAGFGFMIIDECHHVAARLFSQVFFVFRTKYVMGLSATPKRKDSLCPLLHMYMGPFLYQASQRVDEKATVLALKHRSARAVEGDVKVSAVPAILTRLCASKARNDLVAELVVALARDERRNIMVLSERVAQLEALRAACGLDDSRLFVGSMSQAERREAEQSGRVLFASASLCQEGLDLPRLDLLVLASPLSDVVQAVGRILRPCATKLPPVVVDVQDDLCAPFERRNAARLRTYAKFSYPVVSCSTIEELASTCARLNDQRKDA